MTQTARVQPRFSIERYLALVDSGMLGPADRVELLEGVIVAMSPQNPRHAFTVNRIARVLQRVVGRKGVVRVQSPLILPAAASVPEPDVAVVPGRDVDYRDTHPTAALLVVEVADSSLPSDRLTKGAIYAASQVPEFWLVNLRDNRIEVHRDPDPRRARFRTVRIVTSKESLDLAAVPRVRFPAREILP